MGNYTRKGEEYTSRDIPYVPSWSCIPYMGERNARVFLQDQKEERTVVRRIIQDIHVRGSMKIKLAKKLDSMNFSV